MNSGHISGISKPLSRLVQGTIMCNTKEQTWTNELLDAAAGDIRPAVHILGDALEGEARDLAAEHAGLSTRVTALPHNLAVEPKP